MNQELSSNPAAPSVQTVAAAREATVSRMSAANRQAATPPAENALWPSALRVTVLSLVLLLVVYHDTAWSMVATWIRSETFAHGFIIAPISLWLVWRERREIARLAPEPYLPALILLAGAGFVWMVAETAGVVALGQFALVSMICFLVWAVLGTAVVKALAFPLGFLFFMVPVGEFLMDALMSQTADFVVLALQISGIPVYREGNYFSIPSGNWSVVEACSGLRYLIASITLGCLFAYLTYRSRRRRIAFICAALVVPIVANWLRAYMIVVIGHLSSNKLATGVDHLVYGWLFFGLVMLILFWVGSIWREDVGPVAAETAGQSSFRHADDLSAPTAVSTPGSLPRSGASSRLLYSAVFALVAACVWRPALQALEGIGSDAPPQLAAIGEILPASPVGNPSGGVGVWRAGAPFTVWAPHYLNPRASLAQTFQRAREGGAAGGGEADQPVSLFVGYYNRQNQYGELVTFGNEIVMTTEKAWAKVTERERSVTLGDRTLRVVEAQVRGGSEERFLVWKLYWIGGRYTGNDYVAKALIALNVLTGRGDDSAAVIAYTPVDADNPEQAATRLQAFMAAALPLIEARLRSAQAENAGGRS